MERSVQVPLHTVTSNGCALGNLEVPEKCEWQAQQALWAVEEEHTTRRSSSVGFHPRLLPGAAEGSLYAQAAISPVTQGFWFMFSLLLEWTCFNWTAWSVFDTRMYLWRRRELDQYHKPPQSHWSLRWTIILTCICFCTLIEVESTSPHLCVRLRTCVWGSATSVAHSCRALQVITLAAKSSHCVTWVPCTFSLRYGWGFGYYKWCFHGHSSTSVLYIIYISVDT